MNKAQAYLRHQDSYALVERHSPLVKRIAQHLLARLPSSVLLDDLIQAGMIGLIEASRNFDGSKGASFETYAGIRIRGAMLDEIRRGDWVPRSVHRNSRMIAEAIDQVEKQHGRDARDTEVAAQLGVGMEEYHSMLQDVSCGKIIGIEDLGVSEDVLGGEGASVTHGYEDVAAERFQSALADNIAKLPEREALVLSLYYDEELNLREIGEILNVSESRVSQIHSQAMHRLRARLRDWQA
ncbi:RNA polymerase sigma factor FliA [Aeromonas schubertii]|uniref:RNA polymerase sigma factor FliA n=2 Tax=Aeromonas TaxID=642 RepID=A0ABS7VB09_9GAMM|nr:RNA polymerase sigma factor FliA [Aeromonas schubertii]KUE80418.1 RNA polymerase subunit sigma-70 [Aeromonas schubertii]MBZ6066141.1 RNA polymerase sigma factor FliA [Aeromonas schubertii]MBZ6071337.1 RNA polymerase sigma factor FliA [Aeromonas schubertii]QCG47676.1 RNA polymerase sigma factor FliA [Aeromonas schubertii]